MSTTVGSAGLAAVGSAPDDPAWTEESTGETFDVPSIVRADARSLPLRAGSVQTIVTSPPYWGQRDYGFASQMGCEPCYQQYVESLLAVFDEAARCLTPTGTLWLNLGDTYNTRAAIRGSSHQGGLGHTNTSIRRSWAENRDMGLVRYSARQPGYKDKDLMGLPHLVVRALVGRGWFLRCDVVWSKPWSAPENASDRPTRSHEYLFLLTRSPRYYYDKGACPEAHRSVWEIPVGKGQEHRAIFPDELVRRCVALTSAPGQTVFGPFSGSGTTARVASAMGRVGIGADFMPIVTEGTQPQAHPDRIAPTAAVVGV